MSTASRAAPAHVDLHPAVPHVDRRARLLELQNDRVEMFGPRVLDADVAAGDRARDQVSAALDAVGKHLVGGAVQPLDALDDDPVGTGALDLRPHAGKEVREIHDFRLARGIFEHRFAVGERRRHHEVLGAGHGDRLEHQTRALAAVPARALM